MDKQNVSPVQAVMDDMKNVNEMIQQQKDDQRKSFAERFVEREQKSKGGGPSMGS